MQKLTNRKSNGDQKKIFKFNNWFIYGRLFLDLCNCYTYQINGC